MIHGSRIIGGILLIGLLTGMSPKQESLWSRKVMTCKNAECSTDIITWLSNQGAQTKEGKKIEKTRQELILVILIPTLEKKILMIVY